MKYTHEDGTPFSKEEFLEKLRTDKEFNNEFGNKGIDQIQNLINDLKTNPDSRRLMVNAWNVGEIDQMVLPPCHYGFQVYTRELTWYNDLDKIKEIYVNWRLSKCSGGYAGDIKRDTIESANQIFVDGWENNKDPFTGKPLIGLECFTSIPKRAISLMFNMRSTDVGLGLGFNLSSYGLLLMMIAKQVNMIPDELIYNGGDVHLYSNHVEPIKEQLNREPFALPTLEILGEVDDIAHYEIDDFVLKNYQSHSTIKLPLSN